MRYSELCRYAQICALARGPSACTAGLGSEAAEPATEPSTIEPGDRPLPVVISHRFEVEEGAAKPLRG